MIRPAYIPDSYERINIANDLNGLFTASMQDSVNCIVLPRQITGDFNSLAVTLTQNDDEVATNRKTNGLTLWEFSNACQGAQLTAAEEIAARQIQVDYIIAEKHGYTPCIRIVRQGAYDPRVYQFHKDGYNVFDLKSSMPERLMCSYNLASTEILRNEDVAEEIIDKRGRVTYTSRTNDKLIRFALGDIYRQQNYQYKKGIDSAVIHRAPFISPSLVPRIVLLAYPKITL